jgi:hypothetical protein
MVDIVTEKDCYRFSWKAVDSAETEIATDSKTILFQTLDNPKKPLPYLEQYIRTHIQKTQLKRKNRLKVIEWTWLEP